MPRVDQRNNFWMVLMIVALLVAGICAIGFWQSYDIKCGGFGGGKTWVWTEFPPKYKCSAF